MQEIRLLQSSYHWFLPLTPPQQILCAITSHHQEATQALSNHHPDAKDHRRGPQSRASEARLPPLRAEEIKEEVVQVDGCINTHLLVRVNLFFSAARKVLKAKKVPMM